MRAAVLTEYGAPLVEAEVELTPLQAHEVLVRCVASGVCHSDRSVHLGLQDRALPLILGHETSGIVERAGSAVEAFAPGDHVVGSASGYCGVCSSCLRGLPQLCRSRGAERDDGTSRRRVDGAGVDAVVGLGGFATHMLVSERALVKLPNEMPLDRAALLGCAVLTGIGAVRNRARVQIGQSVAVIGCGGVGLNAIQGARISSAHRRRRPRGGGRRAE